MWFFSTRWVSLAALGAAVVGLAVARPALAQSTQTGGQTQSPQYACSITVPPNTPNAKLAGLAKISAQQAEAAAKTAVPGTVEKVRLDDENGCLVYSVKIRGSDGRVRDVKVDAGTGKVLHQELAGQDGEEEEGDED
jgi:hypothetical protein